jgi:hypothetical protein
MNQESETKKKKQTDRKEIRVCMYVCKPAYIRAACVYSPLHEQIAMILVFSE